MRKNRRSATAKSETRAGTPEQIVKDIRRATRKHHSAEEKIRIVLEGFRGEYSIAELCRRKGIAESLYYSWSKEFLEAGKRRLAGDTARAATSGEVKDLRREVRCQSAFKRGSDSILLQVCGLVRLFPERNQHYVPTVCS